VRCARRNQGLITPRLARTLSGRRDVLYRDGWIECTEGAIRVRFYYVPFGTRSIPYSRIRAVQRVTRCTLRGRGRVWETAKPGYWAHPDPARPRKSTPLVLDAGGGIKPWLTRMTRTPWRR
jgi:hypothetical protein